MASRTAVGNAQPGRSGGAPPSGHQRAWRAAAIVALLAITWITYAPSLDNDFVDWDDPDYVTKNPLVLRRTETHDALLWRTPVSLNYHPLTMWTLALDARAAQGPDGHVSPAPFIRTNVVIHAANALLVFVLVWMLSSRNLFVSFFTALIFGVHPMHVESVAWVSQRKDVLYACFFLLAAIAYVRYARGRKPLWLVASLVSFVLSCLSKAMAVSLAPVVVLIDLWLGRDLRNWKVVAEKIPYFLIALFFGLMALDVQRGGDFHGMLTLTAAKTKAIADDRPLASLDALRFGGYGYTQYIIRFFAPFGLCTYHPYPTAAELAGPRAWEFWLGPAFMVVSLTAAAWCLRRWRPFAFGLLFYLATVALVLQFIPVGQVVMAERYTYIPYIGLAFTSLMILAKLQERSQVWRYAAWGIAGVFSLYLVSVARSQVDTWQNSEVLWNTVLTHYPHAGQARVNLGNHYGKTGRVDEAIASFEQALKDGAHDADVYEGLGNAYYAKGDPTSAEEMYTRAIATRPDKGSHFLNRGTSRMAQRNYAGAIEDFEQALPLAGTRRAPMILARKAYCELASGAYAQALADYDRAISLGHRAPLSFLYRAQARKRTGDDAGAIADLQEALRRQPDLEEAKRLLEQYQQN